MVTQAPLSLTWELIHSDQSYTGALQPKSSIIQRVFRVTASFNSEIPSEASVNARIIPVRSLVNLFSPSASQGGSGARKHHKEERMEVRGTL